MSPESGGGPSRRAESIPNPVPGTDAEDSIRASRRARWAIARRELRSLRTEKTILLAIAIQLVIALFSSFLVVGLVSLYDPSSVEGYGTTVAVTGEDRTELLEAANQQEALEAEAYERADAHRAFERNQVSAVLDAARNDRGQLVVRITAPDEGLGTTLLVVQLRDVLEAVEERERLANGERLETIPLEVPGERSASPYFGFSYTVLVPLLCFLPVFVSGSIAVDSLVEERDRGTLELLRVAPLDLGDVVEAKLLAIAALAPIQAAAWLVVLAYEGTAIAAPVVLVVFVAALSLLVVAAGVLVALLAPDRRQAQLLYSGGTVAALLLATALPEHPANTVAKLAVDSATPATALSVGAYCALAILAFLAVRVVVERLDAEAL